MVPYLHKGRSTLGPRHLLAGIAIGFILPIVPTSDLAASAIVGEDSTRFHHSFLRFHGRSRDECTAFLLVESSVGGRMSPSPYSERHNQRDFYAWELGGMVNTGNHAAWGATIYVTMDDPGYRWAILPRFRRWLSHTTGADLSAGMFFSGHNEEATLRLPGYLVRASVSFGGIAGGAIQAEAVPLDGRKADVTLRGGIHFGSYAAILAGTYFFFMAGIQSARTRPILLKPESVEP